MGSANELTQVVRDLVGIPEIFHAEADDINEILHEPEQLLGIWPYLQREAEFGAEQILMRTAGASLQAKVSALTRELGAYAGYNGLLLSCGEGGLGNPKRKPRKGKK